MLLTTISKVLYSQLFVTPPPPHFDCTSQTIIVTGANNGIGKEAARHFVRLGAAKVILACRSLDRGEAAKRDIETSTARTGVVEVWQLDLENYASVKAFAARVVGELERVDAVVANAGIHTRDFRLAEGNEATVTVNIVSTFLLALLLLPYLETMEKRHGIVPTVTFVNSEVHGFTSFPEHKAASIFATLNNEKEARMIDRYNVSKLLNLLSCREIARLHPHAKNEAQTKVTLNLTNPGLCHSSLMREMQDSALVRAFQRVFARTAEVGSRTLVHAAMQGPQSHGVYFSDSKPAACEGFVRRRECAEVQARVWGELAGILEGVAPGVTGWVGGV